MNRSYLFRSSLYGLLILLILSLGNASFAASAGPTLSVNAAAGQKPISPYIYGINFADKTLAAELHFSVDRYGGNATTRYNWQNDTANHASDWYFENIQNGNPNPAALPNGSASDLFIDQDRLTASKTIMTISLIGWTPKDQVKRCGFSIAKYGSQQSADPYMLDCGNGKHLDGTNITGNNPTDTSVAIDPTFVKGWLNHLIGRYGTAANGGVLFYDYDNEPDLWCDTHRDVHPGGATYNEMRDSTYAYGAAIKATDPGAKTLGPVGWGFNSLLYSGGDQCSPGSWWLNPPDRTAHGGVPFGDWYLQQMAAYEQQHGIRILDYYDNHFYPQGANVSLSNAVDSATAALRLRSTRSLWDPTYTDESWIGQVIQLIPRLHNMINADYPGTKTAITEYNWGALNNINGALAQADVLGIFGREGLDLAALWSGPAATDPGAYAFRMYLNYDGKGGHFGETSVSSSSTNQDQLAVYVSTRTSDGALLLMIINRDPLNNLTSSVSLTGFLPAASAQVYRYSGANLSAIVRQPDQAITSTGFSNTFPAYSITLVVIPHANASVPPVLIGPSGTLSTTTPTFTWNAVSGAQGYYFYLQNTNATVINQFVATSACSGNTCSYTPAAPLPGSPYTWTAAAYFGATGWSNYATPLAFLIPPTLIAPTGAITTATPTFTWNVFSGAWGYYLYLANGGGTVMVTQWVGNPCSSTTCSFSAPSSLPGNSYSWWVSAYSGAGWSPWSSPLTFVLPPTLASPTGSISTGTPTYTWNAISNAWGYYLYVKSSGGTVMLSQWVGNPCTSTTCTFASPSKLPAGSFTWTAAAYGAWDWTAYPTPLSFTTAGAGLAAPQSPSQAVPAVKPMPTFQPPTKVAQP